MVCDFTFYPDDIQSYLPLKITASIAVERWVGCFGEIKAWMSANVLCLKWIKNRIDFIWFVDTSKIELVYYSALKFDKQIKEVETNLKNEAFFFTSKGLGKGHPCFIFSRLDYCNSLYYGVQYKSLDRLRLVQNVAARLSYLTQEHITPVLRALHWLLVSYRLDFKILLFVFKALHGIAPIYIADLVQAKKSKENCTFWVS